MRLSIRLPSPYRRLARTSGSFAVEHADLDCRALEALLGAALASGPGDVLLVTRRTDRARSLLSRWLKGGRRAARLAAGRATGYELGGVTLWISPDADQVKPIPTPRFVGAFVEGAQLYIANPIADLSGRLGPRVVISGAMTDRGHWFFRWAREEADELERIDLARAVETWPDLAPNALPEEHPLYRRSMLLEDVEPQWPPFHVFARRRLRTRAEKPPEALRPEQIAQAERELGRDWRERGVPQLSLYLNPVQRKYLARKRLGRRRGFRNFIVVKYRRGGITTLEQALSYELCSTRARSYCTTLAHEGESTRRIFRQVLDFHRHDPEAVPRINTESKSEIELANGSLFFIGTAGQGGFARGEGLQRWHGSEVAKWRRGPQQMEWVDELLAGLLGASMYGEGVLESTPSGRDAFWHYYDQAKKGQGKFWPIFLRWFDDPTNVAEAGSYSLEELRDTLTEEEAEFMVRTRISFPQLAFRRHIKKTFGRLSAQEYPEDDESCFLVRGTPWFDLDVVFDLVERLEDLPRRSIPGGYTIEWEEPQEGVEYAIGCDTSEGLSGCDPNGGGVIRKDTGEQVAAWHGLFSIRRQAELAVEFSKRYNRALLGIERENHGHAVIQKVEDLGWGEPHYTGGPLFYFERPATGQRRRDRHREARRAGWSTNEFTRPIMLSELAEALAEGHLGVCDRDFLGECLSFKLQASGKYEADPGAHDDAVMKWAIAWQMRKQRRPRVELEIA